MRHLANGDLIGWIARIQAQVRSSSFRDARAISKQPADQWRFGILSIPQTENVAKIICERLTAHGWRTEIMTSPPESFSHDWYFVLCPNLFRDLPPCKTRILFPIGASVAECGQSQEYLDQLSNSFAVLAHSLSDIEYLAWRNVRFPLVHYLPLEILSSGLGQAGASSSDARRFVFMFDRLLIALGFLPSSQGIAKDLPLPEYTDKIVLSLPETIERRRSFEKIAPPGYVVFDGLRRQPGWVGCGLSYRALAFHALKYGYSRLSVMEDDVVLPFDLSFKLDIVHEYLDARDGEWDVFSGVIAALNPHAKILSVDTYEGVTFVTINRMTSTVFNIYGKKAFQIFASWNPENTDAKTNTIDRYLEGHDDLRVIVTLPFLVGHREEVDSTLWGSSNKLYSELIKSSEKTLYRMVKEFQPNGVS